MPTIKLNPMKRLVFSFFAMVLFSGFLSGQSIEGLEVELYYISDANDATDDLGGELQEGSKTYRLFLDICDGCKLQTMYGTTNHPFIISSSEPFFNSSFGQTFGHNITNASLSFGIIPLDSYMSFGGAGKEQAGYLKSADDTGSIFEGADLLQNEDPEMGTPINESDGLVEIDGDTEPSFFSEGGTVPLSSAFGTAATDVSEYFSTDLTLQTNGVEGFDDENRILIGQITTLGELEFELNVTLINANGGVEKYVARDTLLGPNESVSAFLKYPLECGCTDPDYIEFDPTAGCDDGSCSELIVFGCLNEEACNFDPTANFDIPELCCFVDSCQGLDISVVCPTLGFEETFAEDLRVYPNPSSGNLFVDGFYTDAYLRRRFVLIDAFGRIVLDEVLNPRNGKYEVPVDRLSTGVYTLRFQFDNEWISERVVIVK